LGMVKEKDRAKMTAVFNKMENNVKIVMFTQETECPHCEMTRKMLEEISGLSDKLLLDVHDFVADADLAKKYGVDKIPAIALVGDKDYGIRFYGFPAGYEFTALIEDIVDVGKRNSGLSSEAMTELAKVDQPVHIQVMISPT
jgi:glutaredoxin-like protein